MRSLQIFRLSILSTLFLLTSCQTRVQKADVSPNPTKQERDAKPVPPLNLSEPSEPKGQANDPDYKNLDADDLYVLARMAAGENEYASAAVAQYWRVKKANEGQYDLACYLARTQQTDAAFYWLQKAAIEEGVDTGHAMQDEDLNSLRADGRWRQVLSYMEACGRYFETADIGQTVLILPTGYQKPASIPAVVWMHGLGSRPQDFVNQDSQELSDRLQVALIGVSGTIPRGPRSFVWAEDIEKDSKRIRQALAEVGDRVTIAPGKVITFGFSQGAQVGLEIAASYPEEFAGSIVLSPGADSHLDTIKPSRVLASRRFVVSYGAKEHPGNVQLGKDAIKWLRRSKAQFEHRPYPGVSRHSFPADFHQRFPEWVEYVLQRERPQFPGLNNFNGPPGVSPR